MMIRKTGLLLIVIVPAAVVIALYLFRNQIVETLFAVSMERMLGSEARLDGVDLNPFEMTAVFGRMEIVDPGDPSRYLVVAGPGRFDLNGLQLFAAKLVIDEMTMEGFSYDVPRPDYVPPEKPKSGGGGGQKAPPEKEEPKEEKSAAPPAEGDTTADAGSESKEKEQKPKAERKESKSEGDPEDEEDAWSIDVPTPELDLSALEQELDVERITSGKLGSIQALNQAQADAEARLEKLDSRYGSLKPEARLDGIQASVKSVDFKSRDPREIQDSIKTLRSAADEAKALKKDVSAIAKEAGAEPGRLKRAYRGIEKQVQEDIDAAMRLIKLGGLSAEEIGALVFGPTVVDRFNWVLEKFRQARTALASDDDAVTEPPRRTGRWIAFPVTERPYPRFLVALAGFSGVRVSESGAESLNYTGTLKGLTSNQKVYGEPMLLNVVTQSRSGEGWTVDGTFDHRAKPALDRIVAKGKGLRLGDLKLGGGAVPEKATTESADITLTAEMKGREIDAELRLDANRVQFVFGDKAAADNSAVQRSIREMFAEFDQVTLRAILEGRIAAPRLRINSSLDKQFMARAGDVLERRRAEAEAKVRREIEKQVAQRKAEVEAQIDARTAGLREKADSAQAKVAKYEETLDAQVAEQRDRVNSIEDKAKAEEKKARDKAKAEERKAKEKAKDKAKDKAEDLLRR